MRYRHLRRTAIAALAAVAFVLLIALVASRVANRPDVRRAAADWLERRAQDRGLDLTVGEIRWGALPPRIILDDLAVTDTSFGVAVDRLEIELTNVRVARRIIELRTVAAAGVQVRLEGRPRVREPRGKAWIRVIVRHLDVRGISFEGEDLPGRIDVSLEGADLAWTTEAEIPSGFLSVERAVLSARALEPIELSLQSRLVVDDGIRFPAFRLAADGLAVHGRGALADGALRLEGSGSADLARVAWATRNPGLLDGTALVEAEVDTGIAELVRLDVAAPAVSAAGFPFKDVEVSVAIERDRLSGVLEQARYRGGRLSGTYRLEHLKGPTRPHRIAIDGDGVALAGLLSDLDVPTGGLSARAGIEGELAWNGRAIEQGRGHLVASLHGTGSGLPVRGIVAVDLTDGGLLRFAAEDLRIGDSVVEWQGPLTFGTWQPNWSIRAAPADLDEVATLVNRLIGSEVLPPSISGSGTLLVTLSGPWQSLVIGMRLDARPLVLPPVELEQVVTEATISGSRLVLGPTRFRVGEGSGEVDGAVTWGEGSDDQQLDLSVRGLRFPAQTVASWIGAPGQVSGDLSFAGGLRGPIADPRGSWAVGFADAHVLGQSLGDGNASIDLASGRFDARAISFESGLEGTAWWDVNGAVVGGQLRWPAMSLAAPGNPLGDLVGGAADLELEFELADGGPLTGRLHADCPDAEIDVTADAGAIVIDATAASSIALTATLDRLDDGGLQGGGRLEVEDAATLIAHVAPESGLPLAGTAAASFDVHWPAGGTPAVAGVISALDLDLDGRPVRLEAPSPFRLSAGGAVFDGVQVAIRADELFARLSVTADGRLAGNVAGTLDALLLRILLPDWEPAGRATGVVEILGTVDEPRLEGIAEVAQASFRVPGTRTVLSSIDGTVLLSSSEVTLDGMDFRFMQGRGRSSGQISRRNGTIDLALNGTVEGLRYTVLPDLVAQLSGPWRLVGPADDLEVSADLTVDSATLRTKDDLPALLLRWFGSESPPAVADGGIALDLHVEADETIELRNPSLRLVGSTSLDIGGTSSRPGIVGKLEFSEGGEITFQTLRYEVERATLTFSDPEVINPFIEVQARTFVQNYDITFRLTGTPQRLIPSVSSNPPLPEDEIYGLMAFGYRSEAATAGSMGIGVASSILTQQLAQELDRRAGLTLPVDQVRVDPFAETATGDPGAARITVVKQLNPSWTVTVQSNLSGEREEVVVSRWYLAPGIFVEGSRDLDGTYGIDLKVRRQY